MKQAAVKEIPILYRLRSMHTSDKDLFPALYAYNHRILYTTRIYFFLTYFIYSESVFISQSGMYTLKTLSGNSTFW